MIHLVTVILDALDPEEALTEQDRDQQEITSILRCPSCEARTPSAKVELSQSRTAVLIAPTRSPCAGCLRARQCDTGSD
jgi:hypothetical protein